MNEWRPCNSRNDRAAFEMRRYSWPLGISQLCRRRMRWELYPSPALPFAMRKGGSYSPDRRSRRARTARSLCSAERQPLLQGWIVLSWPQAELQLEACPVGLNGLIVDFFAAESTHARGHDGYTRTYCYQR